MPKHWRIVTGELPPSIGGVADYSLRLAQALQHSGAEVSLWSPERITLHTQGIVRVRPAGHFGPSALKAWSAAADDAPAADSTRWLLQYTPNSLGLKGCNWFYCDWLARRAAAGERVEVMLHEPYYPLLWRDRPQRWLLSGVQRLMLKRLLPSAHAVWVSAPSWLPVIQPYLRAGQGAKWLPLPSNIPVDRSDAPAKTAEPSVVSFGSYGSAIAPVLAATWSALIALQPDVRILLVGRGAAAHHAQLPEAVQQRCRVWESATPADASRAFQQAWVGFTPFPDGGINARRSSALALLAHGLPLVSTQGKLTEPLWHHRQVTLVPEHAPAYAEAIHAVLRAGSVADDDQLYRRHFSLERTVSTLSAGRS